MAFSYDEPRNNCILRFTRDDNNKVYYEIFDKDKNYKLRADCVGVMYYGYFWVEQNGKFGYYDSVNNIFHDFQADEAENIYHGFGVVKFKVGQNGIIPKYNYQYFDAEKASLGAVFTEADRADPYTRVVQTEDGKWWVLQKGRGVPVAMCKTRKEACAIASSIEKEMYKKFGV